MTVTVYDAADIPQGSPEWLQARAGIITASAIGQLITAKTAQPARNDAARGLYSTLIAERITGRVEPVYPNRAMARGTLLEPEGRRIYADTYGPVDEIGFARLDTDTHTIGASPDGLIGTDGGLEIKSPSAKVHVQTVIHDEVPLWNRAQVQASLYVTGRAWWKFVSYYPGEPLYTALVEPDPVWQKTIRGVCEAFENTARVAIDKYRENIVGAPDTVWWDPLDEGEDIY